MSSLVNILLATYNGANYLPMQLASLIAQTFTDWALMVRDDGSEDDTLSVLQTWQTRYPGKMVHILNDAIGHTGALSSFSLLMQAADAPYIMFCDQDDRWHPHKLERMMHEMRRLEAQHGAETPLLVHSDMRIVDEQMQLLSDSFWHFQRLDPRWGDRLSLLSTQNVVTGCALLANRATYQLALPLPPAAQMHDWWIGLVACAFGQIAYLSEPLVDYRQHATNLVGAKAWNWKRVRQAIGEGDRLHARLRGAQAQADAFARCYASRLEPAQHHLLKTYGSLSKYPALYRRWFILRHSFIKCGWQRNLGMLLWI